MDQFWLIGMTVILFSILIVFSFNISFTCESVGWPHSLLNNFDDWRFMYFLLNRLADPKFVPNQIARQARCPSALHLPSYLSKKNCSWKRHSNSQGCQWSLDEVIWARSQWPLSNCEKSSGTLRWILNIKETNRETRFDRIDSKCQSKTRRVYTEKLGNIRHVILRCKKNKQTLHQRSSR